jgi:hypothetical protein
MTQVHETRRRELNAFLAREFWADAELVQQGVMLILDSLNGAQPLQPGPRIQLFQRLDDRMEHIAEDGGCKSFPIIRRSVEEPSFCGLSFWEP